MFFWKWFFFGSVWIWKKCAFSKVSPTLPSWGHFWVVNFKILSWSIKPNLLRRCGSWEKLYIEVFLIFKKIISDTEFRCWWTSGFLVMDEYVLYKCTLLFILRGSMFTNLGLQFLQIYFLILFLLLYIYIYILVGERHKSGEKIHIYLYF